MIHGTVNQALEATIPMAVQGVSGQPLTIEPLIDTGFNGFLTLPPDLVASLGLPWKVRQEGLLADGSTRTFDVYAAIVIWQGKPRIIEVEAAGLGPLLGTALLSGHAVSLQIIPGGTVTIAAIP